MKRLPTWLICIGYILLQPAAFWFFYTPMPSECQENVEFSGKISFSHGRDSTARIGDGPWKYLHCSVNFLGTGSNCISDYDENIYIGKFAIVKTKSCYFKYLNITLVSSMEIPSDNRLNISESELEDRLIGDVHFWNRTALPFSFISMFLYSTYKFIEFLKRRKL